MSIPADLRPAVIERIRELNALGHSDRQIGGLLGYAGETIRNLRIKSGIEGIRRADSNKGRGATDAECPVCGLLVDVISGIVAHHRGFLGRVGPGSINRTPVHIAENCPASGDFYGRLVMEQGELNHA